MKKKAIYRNYATSPRYNMTEVHYQLFKAMISGLEKPSILKKRLRVYFIGERSTLKWYMSRYFHSFYRDIDDDSGRVVFICDSEDRRNQLYEILNTIRNDVGYTVPESEGDDAPGGNAPGGNEINNNYIPSSQVQQQQTKSSNVTTFLIIGAVLLAVVIIIIKKIY